MVCREVTADGREWNYCPDDIPPAADRLQSILYGRFLDELTDLGMQANLTVTSDTSDLMARVAHNGIAGLVANPFRRFPGLVGNSVIVDMQVSASRYKARGFSRNLGPINMGLGAPADYPDFFAGIDLGEVGLHRQPSVIKGRCVQNSAVKRLPLAGATVEIIGVWYQFPASNVDPATVIEAPNIISLLQGLYADRSAGVDTVTHCNMVPLLGDEKTLLLPVAAGERVMRVSNRINLAANDVLAIQHNHADLAEFVRVVSVEGASTPNQAAVVTLAYPLRKNHREGVVCLRHNVQIPGGTVSNNLTRHGQDDDETLFLDALTDIDETTVEISDGVGVPEYHAVNLYQTLCDVEGYFRLPPIHRLAQLEIRASRADLPAPVDLILSPDYDRVENRFDLIFP